MRMRILLAAALAVAAAPLVMAQVPNCAAPRVAENVKSVAENVKSVAVCVTQKGSILSRDKPGIKWQLVDQKEALKAGDLLIGLPGAKLESGDKAVSLSFLTDFGNSPFPVAECGVILHESKDFDLDVTLDRGRADFTNIKAQGAAKVRVHVHEQIIDLTLHEPKTSVALELYGRWAPGQRFKKEPGPNDVPTAHLVVLVLHGSAELKHGRKTVAMAEPPGAAIIQWDNKGGFDEGPAKLTEPPAWSKADPDSPKAKRLTKLLARYYELAKTKTLDQILAEFIASDDYDFRRAFVIVGAATDRFDLLTPVMRQPKYADLWDPAIVSLRHWIGRAPGQDQKLYKMLIDVGMFKPVDAETTLQLLHSFDENDLAQPETYETLIDYMEGDRILIRALANWHLMRLVPQGQEFKFNPAGDEKDREEAVKKWRKLIPAGKLPPKKDK